MSTIVTRAGKGSPLTNTELDSNFQNLNTDKAELSGATFTGNLKLSDGTEFQLGDSSEFKIKHHASGYTHLENTVGTLFIDSDSVTFRDDDGSPTNVLINQSGIDVTGSVTADGLTISGTGSLDAFTISSTAFAGMNIQAGASSLAAIDFGDSADSNIGGINYNNANDTLNLRSGNLNRLTAASNGDISFYDSAGSSQNLFWDSSTSRLGLGTTVPASLLHIQGNTDTADSFLTIEDADPTTGSQRPHIKFVGNGTQLGKIRVLDNGTGMQFLTGSSDNIRLAIDSSGSSVFSGAVTSTGLTVDGDATISDTTPSLLLMESDTTDVNTRLLNNGGDFFLATINDAKSSVTNRLSLDHATGDISFYEDTGTTPKLFWDASTERLGLGTTSLTHTLHVTGSHNEMALFKRSVSGNSEVKIDTTTAGDAKLTFANNGTSEYTMGRDNSDGAFKIADGGTIGSNDRLTINADGSSVFSGRTTSANSTVGSGTASTYVDLTVNGASTSNYGPMIELQSAGTAFGKISNYGRIQGGTSTDMFVTTASTNSLVLGTNNTPNVTIANGGAATFNSTVTASSYFLGSGSEISLATGSAGSIFLRPNGQSTSGQMHLASSGSATFSNTLEVNNYRYFDGDYNATYYRKANHTQLGYQLHRDNGKSFYEWNSGGTHSYDFQFISNNSPVLSLATNGNVNIPNGGLMVGATTAPTDKLEIRGNAKIEQTSNVDAILRLNPNSGTIGSNYRWELVGGNSAASYGFQIREGTTPYLTINNSAGGNAGNATFSGSVTSTGNTTIKDAGVVRLKAAPSGSLYGGGFDVFSVTGSNTSPYTSTTRFGNYGQNEVMVLTGANVNIPNGSLMVGATTAPSAPLQVSAAPSNTVGAVGISLKDSGNAIEFGLRLDATSKDLHLDRYYSGGWLETMSWDRSTGNVGIGCSPSSTLHIKTSVDNSVSQGLIIERSANTDRGYINYQGGAFRMVATDGDPIRFGHVSNSNEVSIHTDGSLLVGKTTTNFGTQGIALNSNGSLDITKSGDAGLFLNRLSSDGNIIDLRKDSTTVGSIGTHTSNMFIGSVDSGLYFDSTNNRISPYYVNNNSLPNGGISLGGNSNRFQDLYLSGTANVQYAGATDTGIYFNGSFNAVVPYRPDTGVAVDDYLDLGVYSHRWDDIFATNGTIQTSDRNEKQDIESLTEAEERVAIAAKSLLKKFRWKSAVEDKGDDARIHFGIIAQDLQAAFEAEGLDAGRYGMFTSNTWTNEDGEEQTRMGVRYSELLAFIISAI